MKFLPTLVSAAAGFLLAPKLVPKTLGVEKEQTFAAQEAERERQKGIELYEMSEKLKSEAAAVANSYDTLDSKIVKMEINSQNMENTLTTIQNRIVFYEGTLSPGGGTYSAYNDSLSMAESMVRLYINTFLAYRSVPGGWRDETGQIMRWRNLETGQKSYVDEDGLVEYLVCNSEKDLLSFFFGNETAYMALRYNGERATFNLLRGWL